jgi:predicted small metal-binding protein
MKAFACGDVVPGCTRSFTAPDEQGILAQVAAHAGTDHGLTEVPPALVEQVRAAIVFA